MKNKFLLALAVSLLVSTTASAPAFAADAALVQAVSLQGYQVGACTSWRFDSGPMPGYLCSNYPTTVTVADAYTYANSIRQLEARIVELEKKVAELQQPKPQQ